MEEIWKDIPEYEGLYQVSNLGRIKSLERKVLTYNGKSKCYKYVNERILKQNLTGRGYFKVVLCKNGKTKTILTHILVAKTFLGVSKLQIDHIDGNKQNNILTNLEYVTPSENIIRAYKNKLISRKENKIDQYTLNGEFIKTWFNAGDIEKELKIYHPNVIKCCKNKYKSAGGYKWKYHQEKQQQ